VVQRTPTRFGNYNEHPGDQIHDGAPPLPSPPLPPGAGENLGCAHGLLTTGSRHPRPRRTSTPEGNWIGWAPPLAPAWGSTKTSRRRHRREPAYPESTNHMRSCTSSKATHLGKAKLYWNVMFIGIKKGSRGAPSHKWRSSCKRNWTKQLARSYHTYVCPGGPWYTCMGQPISSTPYE
jgi:hypothetical protein